VVKAHRFKSTKPKEIYTNITEPKWTRVQNWVLFARMLKSLRVVVIMAVSVEFLSKLITIRSWGVVDPCCWVEWRLVSYAPFFLCPPSRCTFDLISIQNWWNRASTVTWGLYIICRDPVKTESFEVKEFSASKAWRQTSDLGLKWSARRFHRTGFDSKLESMHKSKLEVDASVIILQEIFYNLKWTIRR
jgi:hypothetical protein